MIDALLYAVRDGIRTNSMNYGYAETEIMDDGRPPPRCGNVFVAVHGGNSKTTYANQRNLYEMFGFSVTLTMRVIAPLDRVGDQQIARNLASLPLVYKQGFHAKCEQLRAYLHNNWEMTVVYNNSDRLANSANDNIYAWITQAQREANTIYGFCEPARYNSGMDKARLVGGEWFGAESEVEEIGIVCELRFDNAKRFQPTTASVGSFI